MTETLVQNGCTSTVQATMTLGVGTNGVAVGTWKGAEVVVGCNGRPPFELGQVPISGKLTAQKFSFPVFPALQGYPPPILIPLVTSSSALAHFEWTIPYTTGPDAADVSLTCTNC